MSGGISVPVCGMLTRSGASPRVDLDDVGHHAAQASSGSSSAPAALDDRAARGQARSPPAISGCRWRSSSSFGTCSRSSARAPLRAAGSTEAAHGTRSPAPPPEARSRRTARRLSAIGSEPPRAMRGHGDVVLLVGRGRDRIDARRKGALLVLRDERRGRHLRDHEAGVQPRLRRQERRQAGERRIDQHRDAPLRQRADLAKRNRDHVGGEGHRLGVEIAAGQRLAVVGEDQRIVGDAVRFGPQASRRRLRSSRAPRPSPAAGSGCNRGPARARRRRDAIRGWRFPASARGARRPPRSAPGGRRRRWMRASKGASEPRAASVESAPVTSAERNASSHLEEAGEREGGRELRAVQERQPLLRAERDRLQVRRRQAPPPPGTRAPVERAPRRRRSSPPSCARAARDRRTRRPSPATARPG